MNERTRQPLHVTVAEKLIEQMKEGTAPWQKPWAPGNPGEQLPHNPVTGNRYNGINVLQLASEERGDPRWMTFNQASSQGWKVRKGEKATPIQFWKFSEQVDKTDDQGRPVLDDKGNKEKETVTLERPKVHWASVFNAEQIEGIPPREVKEPTWNKLERAEAIFSASGAEVTHDQSDRAFYRRSTDKIHMPSESQFDSPEKYYATKFHELGHWTGHESRLDRGVGNNPFGSEEYAKEELRAEIASMIIGDELGLGHDPGQHAAYVKSWIKVLENDPMEIFRAAADAEKIQKFVIGFEQHQEQAQTKENVPEAVVSVAEAQRQTQLKLDELHADSIPGYSPKESWENLQAAAQKLDLKAQINQHDEYAFLVSYTDSEGLVSRVTTGLNDDGKAVSMIDGQRLSGTGMTADVEWQEQALESAVANLAAIKSREIGSTADSALQLDEGAKQAPGLSPLEAIAATSLQANRRFVADGDHASAEVHQEEFLSRALANAFGQAIELPSDWTGNIQIRGAVSDGDDVVEATAVGREPEFFGLYAETAKGLHLYVADMPDLDQAQHMVERLRLIDSHSYPEKSEDIVAEKTPINVPFKEKNEAKALGAQWDPKETTWYVPPGVDLNLFQKWTTPVEPTQQTTAESTQADQPSPSAPAATASQSERSENAKKTAEEKQFLAVPYGEREAAKALGAKWDKAAGSWYVGPEADPEKLQRWTPDAVAQQKKMTPEEEFRDALLSAGLVLAGNGRGQSADGMPVMDGNRYRVPLVDDKPGDKNGVYIGHLDGHPAGFIQNFRTSVKQNWKSKGHSLSDEERANLHADAAIKMQARETARTEGYEEVAGNVQKSILNLSKPESPTVYMEAKGIQVHEGMLTDKGGKRSYVPAQDTAGKVWNMQYIREDGSKRFPKGSRKDGLFHVVGGMDALKSAPALVVGEGYATMSTVTETLGFATVAAFDSGNLKAVAASLKEIFPDKPLLVVGDDDSGKAAQSPSGINAGRMKAEAAAKELNGQAVFPSFAPGELQGGLSDFNDLATRSELGRDGVSRQLKGALKQVLESEKVRQNNLQQEKVADLEIPPKVVSLSR